MNVNKLDSISKFSSFDAHLLELSSQIELKHYTTTPSDANINIKVRLSDKDMVYCKLLWIESKVGGVNLTLKLAIPMSNVRRCTEKNKKEINKKIDAASGRFIDFIISEEFSKLDLSRLHELVLDEDGIMFMLSLQSPETLNTIINLIKDNRKKKDTGNYKVLAPLLDLWEITVEAEDYFKLSEKQKLKF